MLKVDEIDGDDNVRAMRKALVKQSNAILDRSSASSPHVVQCVMRDVGKARARTTLICCDRFWTRK